MDLSRDGIKAFLFTSISLCWIKCFGPLGCVNVLEICYQETTTLTLKYDSDFKEDFILIIYPQYNSIFFSAVNPWVFLAHCTIIFRSG